MPEEREEEQDAERPAGSYFDLVFRPFPDDLLERLNVSEREMLIDLCERAVAAHPTHLDALKALGDAYTKAGRYVEGLKIDKRLVALLPNDASVHYNLACSYALLNLKDQAFEALDRAMALGYDDFEHLVSDEDLKNVRDDPRFRQWLER
jgi:tetratricopeptide (TPR) repeat protein